LPAIPAGSLPLINITSGLPHVVATRSRATPSDADLFCGCRASARLIAIVDLVLGVERPDDVGRSPHEESRGMASTLPHSAEVTAIFVVANDGIARRSEWSPSSGDADAGGSPEDHPGGWRTLPWRSS
jgi:hypothetical protein